MSLRQSISKRFQADSPLLLSEICQGVLLLTLNRPKRCNALSLEILTLFAECLKELQESDETQILILRGNERYFCSGLDLREAADGSDVYLSEKELSFLGEPIPFTLFEDYYHKTRIPQDASRFSNSHLHAVPKSFYMPRLVVEVLYRLLTLPQIVLCGAQGGAFGGGCGIVSVCDYVIADTAFQFGFPELKRGLAPSLLHPFLKRKLSATSLKQILLPGLPLGAAQGERMEIIQEILPLDQIPSRLEELTAAIRLGEPKILKQTKSLLNETRIPPKSEIIEGLIKHWESWVTPQGKEGITSFLEKRLPHWS